MSERVEKSGHRSATVRRRVTVWGGKTGETPMKMEVCSECAERAESRGGQGLRECAWVCEQEREGKSHVCLQHGSR